MEWCELPAGGDGEGDAGARAAREAARCLSTVLCRYCDVCRLLCPDLCITREPESDRIVIDLAYCKGCGICAHYCPKGAIRMEVEKR